jgi:predicted secreted hydrolase
MKRLLLLGTFFLCFLPGASASEFKDVTQDYALKFPADFYYKDGYRVQWWYFTGHLFDQEGREYGYELTFFVVGVQTRAYKSKFGVDNIYISHFALTDVAGKKFYTSEKSDSGTYGFAGAEADDLKVWVNDNKLWGTTERIHIMAMDKDRTLELELTPAKRVVLNGQKGFSRKSEDSAGIASWYFSYTDLNAQGSLKIGQRTFAVHGKGWFDREISSGKAGKSDKGWDWLALQLDDGREIMLYVMRKADGTADRFSAGTVVYRDGRYRQLAVDDFRITSLRHYKSAKTSARYPSEWEIKIPGEGLDLKVTPLLEDQEFVATYSTGNYYWEGTCKVEGQTTGRAYVELTGY